MQPILKCLLKIVFTISITTTSYCIELNSNQTHNHYHHQEHHQNFNFNKTTLTILLKQMKYLNLHLKSTADADNNFVQFLLRQSVCAMHLTMSTGRNATKPERIFRSSEHHRCLVTRSQDMPNALLTNTIRSGIFLCVLLDMPSDVELWDLARRMWLERGIYNVYYITILKSMFFNPFLRIGMRIGNFVDINDMNIDDIFRDLHGYPVRIYIFDSVYSTVFGNESTHQITNIKGADCKVAQLLSEKMNFTMALQWPDDEFFGARLDNGSYNGAIGRAIRYETDITLTGFFVKDYRTKDIVFSVSVYMDELCCYVMKAKKIPQSIVPIFAVDIDIWVAFLLVGAISPLIWIVLRRFNLYFGLDVIPAYKTTKRTLATSYQYVRIFIDTWVVWVRVNIVNFPPFYSERIFVISLCMVSVIFGALFESSLATVYIRPLYYKDINTMQDLDEANFRIYIKHAAMKDDLFFGHMSPVYQNLNRKLMLVAETEERLISMMSKHGGFTAVTRASSLILDDIYYFITKKIHKIPECPKNYHIAYLLPKNSPYENAINIMLLRFVEAGLIDQWIDEMKYKARISIFNFPEFKADIGDIWKILTLLDLQLAFYALVLGCSLATLSFLVEILSSVKILKYSFLRNFLTFTRFGK